MSGVQFHLTTTGRRFFEQVTVVVDKLDRLVTALERIADALEALVKEHEGDEPDAAPHG